MNIFSPRLNKDAVFALIKQNKKQILTFSIINFGGSLEMLMEESLFFFLEK